jgi:hypothetical protein
LPIPLGRDAAFVSEITSGVDMRGIVSYQFRQHAYRNPYSGPNGISIEKPKEIDLDYLITGNYIRRVRVGVERRG